MLDQLAHRYGLLPSQVLKHGDSLDITVMDVSFTYKKYLEQKQDRDSSMDTSLFNQEQLQAAVDRAKAKRET
jgi:hypothetical protein